MSKENATLTLDAGNLAALGALAGSRRLSATVDAAIAKHLTLLQHLAAVDDWIAEMDAAHGPVAAETLEWAAALLEDWSVSRA